MSESSSFTASFLGAFEGAVSVLLTLIVGYHVARIGIVDDKTIHRISRLCTSVFLPCLIVVQMGPELTVGNISKMWIIPAWGLFSTTLAHLLGWVAQACFRTRSWVIVAAGRPNTSALPLLLLESLSSTGVLKALAMDGETVPDTLRRAKSLILLNVVLQQTITFQLAPSLLERDCKLDGKRSGRDEEAGQDDSGSVRSTLKPEEEHRSHIAPVVQDPERVGLLQDHDSIQGSHSYGTDGDTQYTEALGSITDQPNIHWPDRLKSIERPVKVVVFAMSPPLIGAIVGLIVGMIPALNHIFFDTQSGVYTSVTQTAKNLGNLFVALQMFTVGSQLALVHNAHPGVVPATCALFVRFLVMPALSLLFVWATAGRGWYVDDKLVWFLLVLIPAGPSAMLLANVAELVDIDQGPIAGYLMVSYVFSPLMAVVTTLGLIIVETASKRV